MRESKTGRHSKTARHQVVEAWTNLGAVRGRTGQRPEGRPQGVLRSAWWKNMKERRWSCSVVLMSSWASIRGWRE